MKRTLRGQAVDTILPVSAGTERPSPPQDAGRVSGYAWSSTASRGIRAIYLNGKKLGVHPYAYTSFRFDITSYLDLSSKNVLAVRVDNSMQPNSRWYSGSGIYRHVRFVITEPIHIAPVGCVCKHA